ncbi:hypothetical protein [Parvularcula sp. IMCC14364]|uniref:hypothetical protein n=1 Tax=Parvularcula sp. IMCC14364 TaxID=3067902 RepID=UPI0027409186|nr:hypothetical protein [Parvularcula sp. IMCC14364]
MTDKTPSNTETVIPEGDAPPVDNLIAMKVLVIFLGVILVGCAVAFFSILLLMDTDEAPQSAQLPQMAVELALDEEITNMTLDGNDLALQIEGPSGRRIIIVNPYTADHKAVINLTPDPVPLNKPEAVKD